MAKKYSELRKQVYELAINLGVDTKTMGRRRIGRGINNTQEAYLPMGVFGFKKSHK